MAKTLLEMAGADPPHDLHVLDAVAVEKGRRAVVSVPAVAGSAGNHDRRREG